MRAAVAFSVFCCAVACGGAGDVDEAAPAATAATEEEEEEEEEEDVVGASAIDAVDHGRALFLHEWTKGDPLARGGDGLGPLWNASSCVACHNQGGAGGGGGNHLNVKIADGVVWPHHGKISIADVNIGGLGFSTAVRPAFLFASANAAAPPNVDVALVLQPLEAPTISGPLEPLAAVRVLRRAQGALRACEMGARRVVARFAVDVDGRVESLGLSAPALDPDEERCLAAALTPLRFSTTTSPSLLTQPLTWAATTTTRAPAPTPIAPPNSVVERNASALFGAGAIDAIDDDVIADGARVSIALHPEISGKVGRTPEGRVTRFGWKGDVADLVGFVSRACAVEVGLEVPGAPQPGRRDRRAPPGLDLDTDDLLDLIAFVKALPRPVQARSAAASNGAEVFDRVGCGACHVAALGDVDGLYSDLLLHDMGDDLDDAAAVGYYGGPPVGSSREWRTPPLWGVRDSGPWLHDGRAATLAQAIDAHGGEAARVRSAWRRLGAGDRGDLLAFLGALRAPEAQPGL